MIKINLLPTKKKPPKKVIDLQQQLILAVLVLIIEGLGLGYYWMKQHDRIVTLEGHKAANEAKITEQDNLLKEVLNVEDERKKVAEKIEIIEKLKRNQAGPVHLLDEVSTALPQKDINIVSLTENNNNINLDGEALTSDDVDKFIRNLKASPLLKDVMLLETNTVKREENDIYRYKLQFVYKGQ